MSVLQENFLRSSRTNKYQM